jgi:predicted 3-demethylubiquinone-9 3-methyltransferase (glyoxalase superfamily)
MTAAFELNGQRFAALNGGPQFKFTDAISFVVNCETQEEIDYFWDKLSSDGGQEGQCGWLKDRFGLSWQVVPTVLPKLMSGDQKSAGRVTKAITQMKKLDIDALKEAAEGK